MNQIKFKKTELLQKDAYQKVIYWFFAYPAAEVSLNDLTKLVNISKSSAHDVVSLLAREKFLRLKIIGKVWRISCDQQHPFNTTKKIPYHLELVYNSGVIEEVLRLVPNSRSIILFGSYRKGDDLDSSDLDLAVETLDGEEVQILNLGEIPKFGSREKVKVNLLKFSRNKIDLNLFANLANGIVLHGFLEARP